MLDIPSIIKQIFSNGTQLAKCIMEWIFKGYITYHEIVLKVKKKSISSSFKEVNFFSA